MWAGYLLLPLLPRSGMRRLVPVVSLTRRLGAGGADMAGQVPPEAVADVPGSVEELRRELTACQKALAATRAWCIGLEEEQARLWAALRQERRSHSSRASSYVRTSSR